MKINPQNPKHEANLPMRTISKEFEGRTETRKQHWNADTRDRHSIAQKGQEKARPAEATVKKKSKWLKSSQNSWTRTSKNKVWLFHFFVSLAGSKKYFFLLLCINSRSNKYNKTKFQTHFFYKWLLSQGVNDKIISTALCQDPQWWIMQL